MVATTGPAHSSCTTRARRHRRPTNDYPFRWAVHRWISGEGAALERMGDPVTFAVDLAKIVQMLERVSTTGAPPATNRARPLAEYDETTRVMIERASHLIDAGAALDVGRRNWRLRHIWVLLSGSKVTWRATASSGKDDCVASSIGDRHALAIPPSMYRSSRRRSSPWILAVLSSDRAQVDDATLARSRGAAINQACSALPYYLHTYPRIVERSWHKLAMLGVQPLTSE